MRFPSILIGAAALAAALAACSHTAQSVSHPQMSATMDPAKARQAYAIGKRLAAQDRRDRDAHRAEMSRLVSARVTQTRDAGRTISLFVLLENKAAKPIASLDAGIEVQSKTGMRLGLSEIHFARAVPAHATVVFWYPMRYVRFDEDAGTMRLAAGKPKTVRMNVTEIKYADGTDAGYDD